MNKHTPGPWFVINHGWATTGIVSKDVHIALIDIEGEANEENQEALEARSKANAQLIAEAPNLLKVLQLLSEIDGSPENVSSAEVLAARVRAIAIEAITKATQPITK